MIDIIVNEKGAELTSIKFNGKEKLHDGLKDWNRHSPVLFPIVGKLKNGKTNINGREYEMGQHGFARDMNFQKISENKYILIDNQTTYGVYLNGRKINSKSFLNDYDFFMVVGYSFYLKEGYFNTFLLF